MRTIWIASADGNRPSIELAVALEETHGTARRAVLVRPGGRAAWYRLKRGQAAELRDLFAQAAREAGEVDE